MPLGMNYMINGAGVAMPDEVQWTPISMGDGLDGLERRSAYQTIRWTKHTEFPCRLDWFPFDNTALSSFVSTIRDSPITWELFTDAICKSVKAQYRRGKAYSVIALFLVRVD